MNDWKLHGDQCLLPIPKFSNLNAPPNKQREHLRPNIARAGAAAGIWLWRQSLSDENSTVLLMYYVCIFQINLSHRLEHTT